MNNKLFPKHPRSLFAAISILCLVIAGNSFAEDAPPATPPMVESVTTNNDEENTSARIGSTLTLTVAGLESLIQEGNTLVPYLDGLALSGVSLSFPSDNTAEFALERTTESKDTWDNIILRRDDPLSTQVRVSLGEEDGSPIQSSALLTIELANMNFLIVFAILLILILLAFIKLAFDSNLVRDGGKEPSTEGAKKPYSISRVQMSIWFFLIIGAYPFIYLITGELGSISASLLGLMGISASTALGSAVIDGSKKNSNANKRHQLSAEMKTLSDRIGVLASDPNITTDATLAAELTSKKTRLVEVERMLAEIPDLTVARASKGFWRDIVSDAGGVSFHRFQIFAWTLVLAAIFIFEVVTSLKMPEFSETLLGLMGVSSGTYIGFKFPEQPKEE